MKALILFGSPRRKNTYTIVKSFIKGLEEKGVDVNFIDVAKLNINHCRSCNICLNSMGCVIKDDMEMVYKLIDESDIIVLASPVYFGTVTSHLKVLIDRCQPLYNKRFVLKVEENIKRRGYLIFTAGGKNKRMLDSMELVAKFFMLSCNANLEKIIYSLNTDEIVVEDDSIVSQEAYEIAKEIVL